MRVSGRLTMRKEAAQRRSRKTVDVILQAAAHVFSTRGYARCTTNHIAERAGVSIGSLYQYFPNKDAILMKLVEAHLREAKRSIDDILADAQSKTIPLGVLIKRTVRTTISLHGDDPMFHRVILEQAPLEGPLIGLLRDIQESAVGVVVAIIAGDATPSVRNRDLQARIIVHTIEALTHHFAVYERQTTDPEELVDEITRLIGGYLFDGNARYDAQPGE